jgi:flagellar biosynthetic protein FliQ
MTPDMVVELGRRALETMLLVSAPMLLLSLVVGLAISVVQTITQVNEATLSFVPKIIAVFGAVLVFAPWMLDVLIGFMASMLSSIPDYAR